MIDRVQMALVLCSMLGAMVVISLVVCVADLFRGRSRAVVQKKRKWRKPPLEE